MTTAAVWLALASTLCLAQEKPMVLTGAAPCNVFFASEPLRFTTTAPVTAVARDYDGREVWRGESAAGALTVAPQPPGYYELEWQAGDTKGKATFAVVPARPDAPPPSGPLAVDGATAWLSTPGQWEPIGKMLRRVGIGWIRERLSWGQVAHERGRIDWMRYQTVADTFSRQGVREYQIFHDSPDWTHPGEDTRCPDDLRDVYRFTKQAGSHFAGEILAWEPWNEPDISFFDQLGDRYAGVQKAAFLGFRAGNPKAAVLQCSLCRGRSAFSDNLYECGLADYVDIFNFHTYTPINDYTGAIGGWVDLAKRYGVGDRPLWLTEAGIHLEHTNGELTPERERLQAQFIPRSFAISLAGGVDRHFFFVLPFYVEGTIQFGALHQDATPRPALVAIATCVRLLGEGRFLGKLTATPNTCQAYVFDSGRQRVAVVWAGSSAEAQLPVAAEKVRVVDLVGREREVATPGGMLKLAIGPAAQYVVGLGDGVQAGLTGNPRPAGKLPKLNPSKVVVVGHLAGGSLDKDANFYTVEASKPARLAVEVYNFDEAQPVAGRVSLELPAGWKADRMSAEVKLSPLGREALSFELTPAPTGALAAGPLRVWVRGEFPGPKVAPSVSYARLDVSSVHPTRRQDLQLDNVAPWLKNISGNGTMDLQPGPDGGVRFAIQYTAPGDRWCYPRVVFNPKQDWSKYQGLAFEYRCDTDDKGTVVRAQVTETGGSAYITSAFPATKEWRRVVVPWSDLSWGAWSPKDEDGKLDLNDTAGLMMGCNTALDKLTLEVRKVELVAFD